MAPGEGAVFLPVVLDAELCEPRLLHRIPRDAADRQLVRGVRCTTHAIVGNDVSRVVLLVEHVLDLHLQSQVLAGPLRDVADGQVELMGPRRMAGLARRRRHTVAPVVSLAVAVRIDLAGPHAPRQVMGAPDWTIYRPLTNHSGVIA